MEEIYALYARRTQADLQSIYYRNSGLKKEMLRAFAPNILFLNRSFCNIYFADLPECGVHIRHIFFHRHRLVMKNTIIAGRTDKFDQGEE